MVDYTSSISSVVYVCLQPCSTECNGVDHCHLLHRKQLPSFSPSPRPPRNTAYVGVSLADRKSGFHRGVPFYLLRMARDTAPEKNKSSNWSTFLSICCSVLIYHICTVHWINTETRSLQNGSSKFAQNSVLYKSGVRIPQTPMASPRVLMPRSSSVKGSSEHTFYYKKNNFQT